MFVMLIICTKIEVNCAHSLLRFFSRQDATESTKVTLGNPSEKLDGWLLDKSKLIKV